MILHEAGSFYFYFNYSFYFYFNYSKRVFLLRTLTYNLLLRTGTFLTS